MQVTRCSTLYKCQDLGAFVFATTEWPIRKVNAPAATGKEDELKLFAMLFQLDLEIENKNT